MSLIIMNENTKGIIFILISTLMFGSYGVWSKLIGDGFGNFYQGWTRALMITVVLFPILYYTKQIVPIYKKDWKWFGVFLLFTSGTQAPIFYAFNNMDIGSATLLFFVSMLLTMYLFGIFFLEEKLNKIKIVSLVLVLTGLFIIYQFTLTQNQIVYLVLTLISGFMTGIWNTISKKFSNNYPNNQLVFMDALSSIIFAYVGSLLFMEYFPHNIQNISWFWICIYAVVQTINVGLIVYGFNNIEAQIGSIILPVEVIFATIFSYLIFKEVPSLLTILGGLLILFASIIPSLSILKQKNKPKISF